MKNNILSSVISGGRLTLLFVLFLFTFAAPASFVFAQPGATPPPRPDRPPRPGPHRPSRPNEWKWWELTYAPDHSGYVVDASHLEEPFASLYNQTYFEGLTEQLYPKGAGGKPADAEGEDSFLTSLKEDYNQITADLKAQGLFLPPESMTEEEMGLIKHYILAGGNKGFNAELRKEPPFYTSVRKPPPKEPGMDEIISNVDVAFEKLPSLDGYTYRGVFDDHFGSSINEGDIFTDRGYTSSSLSKKFAESWVRSSMKPNLRRVAIMRIKSKTGKIAGKLAKCQCSEVAFKPRTTFRVKGVRVVYDKMPNGEQGRVALVDAEEVLPSELPIGHTIKDVYSPTSEGMQGLSAKEWGISCDGAAGGTKTIAPIRARRSIDQADYVPVKEYKPQTASLSNKDKGETKKDETWKASLYPNPANTYLTIYTNVEDCAFSIFSPSRQAYLLTGYIAGTTKKLDIRMLDPGLYVVVLKNTSTKRAIKKRLLIKGREAGVPYKKGF